MRRLPSALPSVCLFAAAGLMWTPLAARGQGAATLEQPAAAEEAADADQAATIDNDWVRVLRDDGGDVIGLQTAIVRYELQGETERPVHVDLIGAVHVGDRDYYEGLNERFTKYDALLYELVAPEDTVVERGRGTSNSNPVGAIQNGMKHFLELEHQLEIVDYTKANFIHADLSPEEFFQAVQQIDGGFLQMYFRMMGQSITYQSQKAAEGESMEFDLIQALFAPDRARRLKIALAGQMDDMEVMMAGFGGEGGSALITERNKAALEVLREQLDAGKRNIGIFYGAGHFPDMGERLQKDFNMKPAEITWITAWDLAEQ